MSNFKIRIDGDFSSFFSKSKAAAKAVGTIFSQNKPTINLPPELKKQMTSDIKGQLEGAKKDQLKIMQDVLSLEKQIREERKKGSIIAEEDLKQLKKKVELLSSVESKIGNLQSKLKQTKGGMFQRASEKVSGWGSAAKESGHDFIGTALEGAGGALGKIPGWGLIAGATIGAGIGVYTGARRLASHRREMAEGNLKLSGLSREGMNTGEINDILSSGQNYGIGIKEQQQNAIQIQRSLGNVNYSGMRNVAQLTRQTGMDVGELGGMASSFRKAEGGTLNENINKLRDVYKAAMVSALDTSGAIQYMQNISEYTGEMSDKGPVDQGALMSIMSSMAAKSEFFKTNSDRSLNVVKGLEGMAQSADMIPVMMDAANKIPELMDKSFYELENLIKNGVFTKQIGEPGKEKSLADLGLVDKMLDSFKSWWGDKSYKEMKKEDRPVYEAMTGFMAQKMGVSQKAVDEMLKAKEAGGGKLGSDDVNSIIKKYEKDMSSKEDKVMNSVDMGIKNNEVTLEKILYNIGDKLVPTMTKIEGTLYGILDHFTGGKTASVDKAKFDYEETLTKFKMGQATEKELKSSRTKYSQAKAAQTSEALTSEEAEDLIGSLGKENTETIRIQKKNADERLKLSQEGFKKIKEVISSGDTSKLSIEEQKKYLGKTADTIGEEDKQKALSQVDMYQKIAEAVDARIVNTLAEAIHRSESMVAAAGAMKDQSNSVSQVLNSNPTKVNKRTGWKGGARE